MKRRKKCETIKDGPYSEKEIILLMNVACFFLSYVYILIEEDYVRLLGYNLKAGIDFDRKYKTAKGAKTAFNKMLGCRNRIGRVKPAWSSKFKPEIDWLDDREARIDFKLLAFFGSR